MRRLAALFLFLSSAAVISAYAQNGDMLYSNGDEPCPSGCQYAWPINDGVVVSDTIFLSTQSRVTGFDFYTWEYPGDRILRIQWSITSRDNGGTVYGGGSIPISSDVFIAVNEYGFDIDHVTITGLNVVVPSGTSWLSLSNAVDRQGVNVYWDQNSGQGCDWPGCPSQAFDNQVGWIPSETFEVRGTSLPGEDDQRSDASHASGTLLSPALLRLGAALHWMAL